MAVKGGQILHVVGGPAATFVIDRIQTGGVTGINVNEEKIRELGNYETIGTIRDIPDLTFELDSFDVTTELESLLTGGDNSEAAGTLFNLANFIPIDVTSPFKNAGLFTSDAGAAIPALSLESMSYAFSLTDSARMTATLRGDSYFVGPGVPYQETFNGTGGAGPFSFANGPALPSTISGAAYYAYSVMVFDGVQWKRQRLGTDFTNTATGITFVAGKEPGAGTGNIKVVYMSAVTATYLQAVHDIVSPVSVRGRDIFIRVGDGGATPVYSPWYGIQSANFDWRVTLERDEEFGNPQVVAQDFDTPEVSGSITMKPQDVPGLMAQVQAIAGISGTDIANATQDPPELQLEAKLVDSLGATTKTLQVPDAKFQLPQLQGNVGAKLETDFAWSGASGVLNIYKGDPA